MTNKTKNKRSKKNKHNATKKLLEYMKTVGGARMKTPPQKKSDKKKSDYKKMKKEKKQIEDASIADSDLPLQNITDPSIVPQDLQDNNSLDTAAASSTVLPIGPQDNSLDTVASSVTLSDAPASSTVLPIVPENSLDTAASQQKVPIENIAETAAALPGPAASSGVLPDDILQNDETAAATAATAAEQAAATAAALAEQDAATAAALAEQDAAAAALAEQDATAAALAEQDATAAALSEQNAAAAVAEQDAATAASLSADNMNTATSSTLPDATSSTLPEAASSTLPDATAAAEQERLATEQAAATAAAAAEQERLAAAEQERLAAVLPADNMNINAASSDAPLNATPPDVTLQNATPLEDNNLGTGTGTDDSAKQAAKVDSLIDKTQKVLDELIAIRDKQNNNNNKTESTVENENKTLETPNVGGKKKLKRKKTHYKKYNSNMSLKRKHKTNKISQNN